MMVRVVAVVMGLKAFFAGSHRTAIHRCLFFFQAEDGIRDYKVTGVQTCALPIFCPTRSLDETTAASTSSGSSPRRWIAKVTAGGIDAEIEISEMRYGEPFLRSDVLVISWRAVALMTSSACVPGWIFSMPVFMRRLAIALAWRALAPAPDRLFPFMSWLALSPAVPPPCPGASCAFERAVSAASAAASWCRLMKLTGMPFATATPATWRLA